jgi:glycine/D-amino acid oxidase-like deaminating enzyme
MSKTPVTIVGGGVVGCVAAWSAFKAGHTVSLFEKAHLGSGASGQALGILAPSDADRALDELQRQGCAAWPALITEIAEAAGTEIIQLYRTWPKGAQINIPALFQTFATLFDKIGITVVKASAPEDTTTPTLWAAGWGNAKHLPGMTVRAGTACRLAPCGLTELLVGKGHPTQGIYAVPDWDGTVLLGTHNVNMPNPHIGAPHPEWLAELRTNAGIMFPPLESTEIIKTWVGNRPTTSPRLPLLRSVSENNWAVAGLGGIGYALAPVVAAEWLNQMNGPTATRLMP